MKKKHVVGRGSGQVFVLFEVVRNGKFGIEFDRLDELFCPKLLGMDRY